jgi:hypothetical protein
VIDLLVTTGACAFSSILIMVILLTGLLLKQKAVPIEKGIVVTVGLSLIVALTILFHLLGEVYIIVAILILLMAVVWQTTKRLGLPVVFWLAVLLVDFLLLRWGVIRVGSPMGRTFTIMLSFMHMIAVGWLIYYYKHHFTYSLK